VGRLGTLNLLLVKSVMVWTKQILEVGSRFFFAAAMVLAVALPSCAAPKGVYHRVERGQTFYRICKTYQVDADTVARMNRIRDRSDLQVGQRLFIPGVSRTRYVPATANSAKTGVKRKKPNRNKKSVRAIATADSTKPAPAKTSAGGTSSALGARKNPSLPAGAKGKFSWPVQGTVVKNFGQKGSAVSKGVEIAVPSGSGVRAAAAGKVTYSGNGIAGYGNLIILKHDDSYFTVYGFNKKTLVRTGEYVSKEQRIALSGTPPGGGKPRIHFEIRRGKEALDPLYFLP
jgi:murein DD-endopeptidase MepM/ murein hydrolase activator NlpD